MLIHIERNNNNITNHKMFKTIIHKLRKKTACIGLDIGATRIKALLLSQSNEGYQVESYAIVSYQEDKISAINTAIAQLQTKTFAAVISIADAFVISKIVSFPATLHVNEIYTLLTRNTSEYFSHSSLDLCFDMQVLGLNNNDQMAIDVLLIASHKNQVNSQIDIVSKAGLAIKIIDVHSFAIERAFSLVTTNHTFAVIDLGKKSMLFLIIQDNNIIFTHTENILAAGHTDMTNNTVTIIQRALQLFFANHAPVDIQQLFLIGGATHIPNFIELLSMQLTMTVIVANPFLTMKLNQSISQNDLYRDAPDLILCCGLALRAFC